MPRTTPAAPVTPVSWTFWLVLIYAVVVLSADFLASAGYSWPFQWSVLLVHPHTLCTAFKAWGVPESLYSWLRADLLRQFDFFKFTFWLMIPLLFSIRWMDWGWFGVRRWKRMDRWLLAGFLAAGIAGVLLIPWFPSLRNEFPSLGQLPGTQKAAIFLGMMVWNLAWLPGWEFLHRYVLVRKLDTRWPRYGWMLIPVFETLYHLNRPAMAAGMALFSIVATLWTRKRRNAMLPFIVHFAIEIALWVFILFA
jgi:hypothetical protein